MACFIVPATEAVVTAVASHILESKEKKSGGTTISSEEQTFSKDMKLPFSRKLKWLTKLLCGGSLMLAFEHLWHGEIQLQFPFLTAASDAESAAVMLHEMAATGVGMAALVTVAWIGMLAVSSIMEKHTEFEKSELNQEVSGL